MARCALSFMVIAGALVGSLTPECSPASTSSEDFWSRVNETTPVWVLSQDEREGGWLRRAWDGSKRIWSQGTWDLYLSGYVWHLPFAYSPERQAELNDLAWGGGLGKTLTDEQDNQRSLYFLATKDSYYKWQFMAGYTWMARWKIANSRFRFGAGYTAFLMARNDYLNYIPIPVLLPLVNAGTNRFSLFGTYVPVGNVFYFFGRLSFK